MNESNRSFAHHNSKDLNVRGIIVNITLFNSYTDRIYFRVGFISQVINYFTCANEWLEKRFRKQSNMLEDDTRGDKRVCAQF